MSKIIGFVALCAVIIGVGIWALAGSGAQSPAQSAAVAEGSTASTSQNLSDTNSVAPDPSSTSGSTASPTKKVMSATLHTSMGDITLVFFPEIAPNTVQNFLKLASTGFYDGTKFHRVIKGFMDQGGDPLTKDDAQMARWGTGGPGYTFADEIGPNSKNLAGTLAMANSGPNTNGSQFYINAVDNPSLDGGYTVFGKVADQASMNVVIAINNTPTDSSDRPLTPVVLKSITINYEQ